MDVGISLQFLQSNSEDDIFILWMDDRTYWSHETIDQREDPICSSEESGLL